MKLAPTILSVIRSRRSPGREDPGPRLNRDDEAGVGYRQALELTSNEAEQAVLTERLANLDQQGGR
ncbi:hypothetical protein [Kribbella sp. NPDC048928]|uniref:hypothetical protein n=1 Tax=Kribbella sp. NPDC048928 TaxID=3364111 RepID=UPI00371516D6